jgi:predicted nucleotidyltransferase
MRLSKQEQSAIVTAIHARDQQAEIYLHGSRAEVNKRGGDIDLLIFSQILGESDKRQIRWAICEIIGEQKIDIVIAKDTSSPFVRIALAKGIRL